MDNGQSTVRDILYAPRLFTVPPYQRAYAWEQRQLQDFLQDLMTQRLGRPYFLGAVLLERQGDRSKEVDSSETTRPEQAEAAPVENKPGAGFEEYQIVDGQQRLTTVTIFLSVALDILEAANHDPRQVRLWKRLVCEEGEEKFRTVPSDAHFFSTYILGQDAPTATFDTPSQRRLWTAKKFFRSELQSMVPSSVAALIRTLEGAKLLIYAVENRVDAAQIFELNNDRGRSLTRLESIKSFLMYLSLLHSRRPDRLIGDIRGVFEDILRIAEDCNERGSDLSEDSILRYHCIGFEQWTAESQFADPKQLIKDSIASLQSDEICEWVRSFCARLLQSFQISKQLIVAGDTDGAIGDLFVLGRVGPFFPLLLKASRLCAGNQTDFLRIVRLLEVFSFRAYGIANRRSSTGVPTLYAQARDFNGDFRTLAERLQLYSTAYWEVERLFYQQLESPNFYGQSRDARYLLWKYENYLRLSNGFPAIPIRDFVSADPRLKFSMEHIAAQTVDKESSIYELAGRNEEFTKTLLHSIGNLVLDTHSGNSRRGNDPFQRKLAEYEQTPLMSQLELEKFARRDPDGNLVWDVDAIKARAEKLIGFAKRHWDPMVI